MWNELNFIDFLNYWGLLVLVNGGCVFRQDLFSYEPFRSVFTQNEGRSNWFKHLTYVYECYYLIFDLSTALGLDCWGCFSDKSWADCENKLESKFCDDDPEWVCMTKVIIKSRQGNSVTYYMKECAPRVECDAAQCNVNVERRNTTYRCQLECCCHDNCNTGVLLSKLIN